MAVVCAYSKECLIHGIKKNLWLMQYQYADEKGHIFQGDRKAAIRKNWERMDRISPGDWFAAYLKTNRFFAVGKVITPRRAKTIHDFTDTIKEYLDRKKSHEHTTGFVYYTSAFYEDFADKWVRSDDVLMRCAQRIDVDQWLHYVPGGVPVKGLNKTSPDELQKAVFKIPKGLFEEISKKLAESQPTSSYVTPSIAVGEGMDDSVVEVLEKSYAKGQGFLLDSKLRKALEDYAMAAAKRHFESEGYVVEDCSKNCPYDLHCRRKQSV